MLLSYSVLYVVTQKKLSIFRLITGGTLMGFGISAMHYTGMAAMQMSPAVEYHPVLFVTSIVIGVVAANAALWITHTLNIDHCHLIAKRIGAAFLMSLAITGMHYTGMAAAHFPAGSMSDAASGIDSQWLATTIILFTSAILIVTLILSSYDARTNLLSGSVSKLNGQIFRLATIDTLTDLPNRWTLMEQMERAIAVSSRRRNMFAILFMDLDGFKIIMTRSATRPEMKY